MDRKNAYWNSGIRFAGWISAAALTAGVALAAEADKSQKLAPDKLPAQITAAINGRFPGGTVTSAEREVEDGKVVFDIELKHENRKYEMDIKEDGTIIEIEKEIKNVPPAVTKAVTDKYPNAQVKECMEVNTVKGKDEHPDHYEVTFAADGKSKGVVVALDGSSVKEEAPETPTK
jgi:hypothetical protein